MEEKKPRFKLRKQGYDRFAVDAVLDRLQFQLDANQQQLETYIKQSELASEQLEQIKDRYQKLVAELGVREKAADDIARLALKEANSVISTAQSNADTILNEALSTARMILQEIARISKDAQGIKEDLLIKVQELHEQISAFNVPRIPAIQVMEEEKNEEQDTPSEDA